MKEILIKLIGNIKQTIGKLETTEEMWRKFRLKMGA